jgi:hypothetical protein
MEHLKCMVIGLFIVSLLCLVAGWAWIGYDCVIKTLPYSQYVLVSIVAVALTYFMGYLARLKS